MDFSYLNTLDFSAFLESTPGQNEVSVVQNPVASIETYHGHLFHSSQRLTIIRKT